MKNNISLSPENSQAYYNEKEARDLCRILLDAVKYIHELGIVHRDLKPENLLLTSQHDDANIKLADFGFARSVLSGFVSTQCGTPGYVAPEILRNESYGTVRSVNAVWSKERGLFCMLTRPTFSIFEVCIPYVSSLHKAKRISNRIIFALFLWRCLAAVRCRSRWICGASALSSTFYLEDILPSTMRTKPGSSARSRPGTSSSTRSTGAPFQTKRR